MLNTYTSNLPKGWIYNGEKIVCDTCGDYCGQCGSFLQYQRLNKEFDDLKKELRKK